MRIPRAGVRSDDDGDASTAESVRGVPLMVPLFRMRYMRAPGTSLDNCASNGGLAGGDCGGAGAGGGAVGGCDQLGGVLGGTGGAMGDGGGGGGGERVHHRHCAPGIQLLSAAPPHGCTT